MQTVIFHSTIYGPIHSRRLGMSLGINLMPNDGKICSFDCLYCEAGFNAQGPGKDGVPSRDTVKKQLKRKFEEMKAAGQTLDVITFSGNGEPTLHPEFKKVVEDVMRLRTQYFPEAKVSVLSNSTMAGKPDVFAALQKVDNNILKLDSALPHTFRIINRPVSPNCLPEGVIADRADHRALSAQACCCNDRGAGIAAALPDEVTHPGAAVRRGDPVDLYREIHQKIFNTDNIKLFFHASSRCSGQ